MSLIHDALKKTEQGKKPVGPPAGPLNPPIVPSKYKPSKPKPVFLLVLGISLLFFLYMRFIKKSDFPKAPSPLTPTSALNLPDDPQFLKKSALTLFKNGKLEKSLPLWQKLTLLLPTDEEIYNNMGLTLKKLGRGEEAYSAYAKALALKKDYPEALNNLGVLYLGDGEKQKARPLFQEAIHLNADYPDPYLNLAVLLEQEGNLKQAHEYYGHFLTLSPEIEAGLKEKIQKKVDLLSQ